MACPHRFVNKFTSMSIHAKFGPVCIVQRQNGKALNFDRIKECDSEQQKVG